MLVQFVIKNYKCFGEPVSLSFAALPVTEHGESLILQKTDNTALLPVNMIYGQSGSGKSTVISALNYLASSTLGRLEYCPFHLPGSSEFSISFIMGGINYNYHLSVAQKAVCQEMLYIKPLSINKFQVLFERDPDGVYLSPSLDHIDIDALDEYTTALSFFSSVGESGLEPVIEWIKGLKVYDPIADSSDYINSAITGVRTKKQLLSHLSGISKGISDIFPDGDEIMIEKKYSRNESFTIPISQESKEIRTATGIISRFVTTRTPMVIDDLNLHHNTVSKIISLFTNTRLNKSKIQLICTTNDLLSMNVNLLRRDEIYIASADKQLNSTLYCLAQYQKANGEKVRKDEIFYKQYLEGRYGGI